MPEVIVYVEDNPKRPGTGAHIRYGAYAVGRTRDDLLEAGLSKRDIEWDTRQGHVRFGEGERSTTPLSRVAAPATPTPSPRPRSVPPASTAPETPGTPPATSSGTYHAPPPGRVSGPPVVGRGAKGAAWWIVPVLLEAIAPEGLPADLGNSGRTWTLRAVLGDGRVLVRQERSDRLALARYEAAARLGIDPDEWKPEEKAA